MKNRRAARLLNPMRDKRLGQEPGGRREDTCDHSLSIQKLESRSVRKKKKSCNIHDEWDHHTYVYCFFFLSHFCFPLSGQAVVTDRCRSVPPPRFLSSIFVAHTFLQSHCSSISHRSLANSRSRAFRKSICAQEKVPTNLYEYALGGARTHETDLYQARG